MDNLTAMDYVKLFIYRIHYFFTSPEVLHAVFNNRFILILMVIFLIRLKYNTYTSMWASALVNIPGTILHETMHFVVGLLLNAKPCNFTVIPRKGTDGSYVMGSVGFRNVTYYNAIPAALAPLLLLVIGYYINKYYLPMIKSPTIFNYMFYVLIQTIIIENSIPSNADLRVAGMFYRGIFLYTGIFFLIVLFY